MTVNLNISKKAVRAALQKSIFYKDKGEYEQAFAELQEIWKTPGSFPGTTGLELRLKAEVLLTCGSLAGFLGFVRETGQEHAKNILTRARDTALLLDQSRFVTRELLAAIENDLAVCEWRNGYYDNAKIWLEASFTHDLPESSEIRLTTHLLMGMIHVALRKYEDLLQYYLPRKAQFDNSQNKFTKATYYLNLSFAYRFLEDFSETLKCLGNAQKLYIEIEHKPYLGITENNFAAAYLALGDYKKAHSHIDSASNIFQFSGDAVRQAYSWDSKARIFLAERNFEAGLHFAKICVAVLYKYEAFAYLVESLVIKFTAEFYLNDLHSALRTYHEAQAVAARHLPARISERITAVFADLIRTSQFTTDIIEFETSLEEGIEFVMIDNQLAITRRENIKPGDFVVLNYENVIYAGIIRYDRLLDLIIVEFKDDAPLVISRAEANSIRKIVGFSSKQI